MNVDTRNITAGNIIPCENYCDQPYVAKTDDGAWLCAMTTGQGVEGQHGQHIVTTRSMDQGRTWSPPIDVEPAEGPEASYAVLLKTPVGRVHCFYNHNTDVVREVKREEGGVYTRVDSLGHYVFKYSDDDGRSWSKARFPVPVREFDCDRSNVYGGKLRFFWNVGRPLILGDRALLVLHKVGAMGPGFFAQSEGVFLRSPNLLTESDPENVTFETLPLGEVGLRTPPGGGRIAEEQSLCSLSDGSLHCVYRTIDGHPACAYSRDGGETWTQPQYASYTPEGRRIKHPRAATFAWRCSNGKFLYWFHNHGGRSLRDMPEWGPYEDRNPVWLCAGVEQDSPEGKVIHWSQPEILLYDDDPYVRMSYPDLIEEQGRFFVTETQKNVARVHEIPLSLADGLFNQWDNRSVTTDGLVLDLPGEGPMPRKATMPRLPDFHQRDHTRADHGGKDLRAGFSLDLWLTLESLEAGQRLLETNDEAGKGILVSTSDSGTVKITLKDGREESSWDSNPGIVQPGNLHHVVIIVDGGPKIISFVVDGVLCDGGECRQFGWGRFSPTLRTVNGAEKMSIAPQMNGRIFGLRLYSRYLRTSEAVGNYRAGIKGQGKLVRG
ncbi:MAG: exo-alpha-sialidase [Armatimonadetes bacterium]|nr:exo-alpha-sialidase [Armatimonadota bacterium]